MNTRVLAFVLLLFLTPIAHGGDQAPKKPAARNAGATLRIVKDGLYERDGWYLVKGSIYNPNARAVKNVVIEYRIWKKFMGKLMGPEASVRYIEKTGGMVRATIKYLPPKQTVEFVTDDDAVTLHENGELPDPLKAEITAEWDQ